MRRYIIIGILALLAIAAGFTLRLREDRKAEEPSANRYVESSSIGSLVLNVRREGDNLRLLWDPKAMPHAASADLYITDGGHESKLSLNQSLFAAGNFSYIPITRDVTFRLEIEGGPRIAGSVKPWGDPPQQGTVLAAGIPRKLSAKPAAEEAEAAAETAPAETRPSPFPSLQVPEPLPASTVPPPVVPPPPSARPSVSYAAEPLPPSRIGRVVGRVGRLPLVRRLKRSTEPLVPPRPVRQVMPVISMADRRTLALPLAVAIRVGVDEAGRVESAEPTAGTGSNNPFANAAISAARNWRFLPARIGDEPVPGKVILHFKFQPAN